MGYACANVEDWLKRLYLLQLENVQLKTVLARNVQHATTDKALIKAEYFQSRFLYADSAILILRHELSIQPTSTACHSQEEHIKMEQGIQDMEKGWALLKAEFTGCPK